MSAPAALNGLVVLSSFLLVSFLTAGDSNGFFMDDNTLFSTLFEAVILATSLLVNVGGEQMGVYMSKSGKYLIYIPLTFTQIEAFNSAPLFILQESIFENIFELSMSLI